MFTRTDRRRFPILLAVLAALALAMPMLFSTVQAQEGSAPDQPRGLDATATHGQVVLTWDAPEDESITGYVVLRRVPAVDPEGQFRELVSDTGTDATTYTDDTVSAETRYTYRIKAINEHGVSERSRWVHINVPAAPEAAEGDDQDGEGDDGAPGKRANVSEGGTDCPVNTTTTCEVDVGGSATGDASKPKHRPGLVQGRAGGGHAIPDRPGGRGHRARHPRTTRVIERYSSNSVGGRGSLIRAVP